MNVETTHTHRSSPNSESQQSSERPLDVESQINATHKLVTELKKAYDLALKEKDIQILKLKQENTDLKTLIAALEGALQDVKEKK